MRFLTKHVWSAVILTTAFGLTAARANAQQGTFHLPFEARWGVFVLPPGSYRFSVPLQMSWPQIVKVSGHGKTVSIPAGIEASQPQSDHSYLSLFNIDGTQVVREFNLGASGKVLTFLPPKMREKKWTDRRKVQTTRLPVGASWQ